MKYLFVILIFINVNYSFPSEYQKSYLKQLECFRPFLQDKFFKENWKKILAWSKDYKADFKRFGPKRFFIRSHNGDLSHLPVDEKWAGLLFKDSNYKNSKWYFELERMTFQYLPRKLTQLKYKTPYEFSILRAAINKINKSLAPHDWRLTTPVIFTASLPPIIFFWGGAYFGVEALGVSIKEYQEKNKIIDLIENDYRYLAIQRLLEDETYDQELAISKGIELRSTYNLYFDTIRSFIEEGGDLDDPELSKFFLSSVDVIATYSPIFNRVYGYSHTSFWNNPKIEYLKDKGLDFLKMHKLMLIAQKKLINNIRIESYFTDLENGRDTSHYQLDSYLEDEFVKKVLDLRNQNISLVKIKFWLMKDLDNTARMKEYEVLGVRYRLPEELGKGFFDLDILRGEILNDIAETLKELP